MTTNTAMVMPGPGEAPVPERRAVPEPGAGEALVRVRASSMNYHDLVNLLGLIPGPWPRVPMTDGAGEVVAVGDGADGAAVGDRVFGAFLPRWHGGELTTEVARHTPGDSEDGWLQQYKVFPAASLIPSPDHLDDVGAATLACAGITAWSALEDGAITAGDTVVTMGTGGVSLMAVQLAKARGATVVLTSSSDDKLAAVAHLGADHTINYRTTPQWEDEVRAFTDGRGCDLVLDLGGEQTLPRSCRAVRTEGLVSVIGVLSGAGAAQLPVTTVMTRRLRVQGVIVGSVAAYHDLVAAVSAHGIVPPVSHRLPWTELAEAQRVQQANEHLGKIGLEIGDEA